MTKGSPLAPHPRGWYEIAASKELRPGKLKSVKFFDQEMVIFRGQNGITQVVDAYCPHLGAHLGKGGRIIGDTIRCPFHGWRFNQEGKCISIPYCPRIPQKARLKCYQTREIGQAIFIFYSG